MRMSKLEKLRKEGVDLINKDNDKLVMRSCWHCNGAHEYLKESDDCVILCIWCGKYYYKGVDITDYGP